MADFQCPYADPGHTRCPESRCDCFIEQYPDDPFGLHPETFVVMVACQWCGAVGLVGGRICQACGRERGVEV